MIAISLCAAGAFGFFVGLWSNWFMANRILPVGWQRCKRCMNAHAEENHEQWEGWDK